MEIDVILAELNDRNPDAVLLDNMRDAIVGLGTVGHHDPVAVYSRRRILDKLCAHGFSSEDAEEYFSKFSNLWAAENTPVILDDILE